MLGQVFDSVLNKMKLEDNLGLTHWACTITIILTENSIIINFFIKKINNKSELNDMVMYYAEV